MPGVTRRQFVVSLATLVWVAGVASPVRAAGRTGVKVSLDRDRVQVGARITYVVEVTREGAGTPPDPVLPAILGEAFRIEGPFVGSSVKSIFIQGRASRTASFTHTYTITPLKPGEFRLGAHIVDDGGSKVSSNDPLLVVSGEPLPAKTTPEGGKPSEARGEVFLWGTVDKTQAYVGEQIVYALEVYERTRFMNIGLRTLPTFKDFWTEELPEGERRNELVDGIPYRVHPGIGRALFPQRAGTLGVGSAEATVGLRRRVTGDAITITVQPLPAQGQPSEFVANNVGRYSIEARVDRNRVEQGQPLTLSVSVDGVGNVRVVEPDRWPVMDGMRRYDPKIDTIVEIRSDGDGRPLVGGKRTYEFLIIPDRVGKVTIPVHKLHFFDPTRERYDSVETAPIEIDVVAGTGPGLVETQGRPSAEKGTENASDLRPPVSGDTLPRHVPRRIWLTPGRWIAGMTAVPTIVAAAFVGRIVARKVGGDDAARIRAQNRARRRELLDDAREAVDGGDGFHATMSQLLQDVAVERAGSEGVGLTRPALLGLLADRGMDESKLDRLRRLLDRCDAARFGSETGDAAARRQLLDETLSFLRDSGLGKGVI